MGGSRFADSRTTSAPYPAARSSIARPCGSAYASGVISTRRGRHNLPCTANSGASGCAGAVRGGVVSERCGAAPSAASGSSSPSGGMAHWRSLAAGGDVCRGAGLFREGRKSRWTLPQGVILFARPLNRGGLDGKTTLVAPSWRLGLDPAQRAGQGASVLVAGGHGRA